MIFIGTENKNSKEKVLKAFRQYKNWFDSEGYVAKRETFERVKDHWKIDATIETSKGKKTDTFFMTDTKLSKWVGIGKEHEVVKLIVSEHKPSRFDDMRRIVDENRLRKKQEDY